MQFARLAVGVHASPVVEAERGVGALLNLVENHVLANGVDEAARDEEREPGARLMAHERLLEPAALHVFGDGLGRGAWLEPGEDRPAARDDAPHLGLRLAAGERLRGLAWMHLHTEATARVDHLEQQRK